MVMKDKLYKSGHKGMYYNLKKFGIVSACVLFSVGVVSVPTIINLQKHKTALAETVENLTDEDILDDVENEESDTEEMMSYCENISLNFSTKK